MKAPVLDAPILQCQQLTNFIIKIPELHLWNSFQCFYCQLRGLKNDRFAYSMSYRQGLRRTNLHTLKLQWLKKPHRFPETWISRKSLPWCK